MKPNYKIISCKLTGEKMYSFCERWKIVFQYAKKRHSVTFGYPIMAREIVTPENFGWIVEKKIAELEDVAEKKVKEWRAILEEKESK